MDAFSTDGVCLLDRAAGGGATPVVAPSQRNRRCQAPLLATLDPIPVDADLVTGSRTRAERCWIQLRRPRFDQPMSSGRMRRVPQQFQRIDIQNERDALDQRQGGGAIAAEQCKQVGTCDSCPVSDVADRDALVRRNFADPSRQRLLQGVLLHQGSFELAAGSAVLY